MPSIWKKIVNFTAGKDVPPTKPCLLSDGTVCKKFVAFGGHDDRGKSLILCQCGGKNGIFGEITPGEAAECLAERNRELEES